MHTAHKNFSPIQQTQTLDTVPRPETLGPQAHQVWVDAQGGGVAVDGLRHKTLLDQSAGDVVPSIRESGLQTQRRLQINNSICMGALVGL